MTRQAHLRRLAEKKVSKAAGKEWGKKWGFLMQIRREINADALYRAP